MFYRLCGYILKGLILKFQSYELSLPVRCIILKDLCFLTKVSPDGNIPQQAVSAPSRVAAVGPYIQSSTMPRMPSRPELLVKPALPDGSLVMPSAEGPMKMQTLPNMRSAAASQSKGKAGSLQALAQLALPHRTVFSN